MSGSHPGNVSRSRHSLSPDIRWPSSQPIPSLAAESNAGMKGGEERVRLGAPRPPHLRARNDYADAALPRIHRPCPLGPSTSAAVPAFVPVPAPFEGPLLGELKPLVRAQPRHCSRCDCPACSGCPPPGSLHFQFDGG